MNWLAFSHGATLGASLIVAIGAQNAFVLRQGIMRAHVGKVVLLCALSDMLLIAAGVGGASALVERYPVFVRIVLYAGLAYLVWFGLNALYRAIRANHAVLDASGNTDTGATRAASISSTQLSTRPVAQRALPVILMTLAFTWLNPHVYLDTFLLIGTAGAREPENARISFALGAMAASAIWFTGLGYGARLLAPWFKRAFAWRVLDGLIGCMILFLAAGQLF